MVHIVVTMRAKGLDIVRLHTILLLLGSTEVVRSSPQPTTVRSLLGRRFSLVYSALFLRLAARRRVLGDSGWLFVDIVRLAAHLQPLMSFVRVRPYPTAGGLFLHCGKHSLTHTRCRAVCASLAWYTHTRCLQRVPCIRLPGC